MVTLMLEKTTHIPSQMSAFIGTDERTLHRHTYSTRPCTQRNNTRADIHAIIEYTKGPSSPRDRPEVYSES